MSTQSKITIVDYKAGNLTSVETALNHIGAASIITSDPDTIAAADKVIFPGVGEARQAMNVLRSTGIGESLKSFAASGKPLLGICLGCQIIQDFSEENNTPLLGLIPGQVRLFPTQKGIKVPQIGWNTVRHDSSALFADIPQETAFYFVHSYYLSLTQPEGERSPWVCGTAVHGLEFAAAVHCDNVWGTQFHPEKSGPYGLALLRNFVSGDF